MDLDPTQTGGAGQEEQQPSNPRLEMMAQIAANVAVERGDAPLDDPPAPINEELPLPDVAAGTPAPAEDLRVKVKVDGVEQELPISEVVKGYQVSTAANRRMQEAAEMRKAVEAEKAALLAQQGQRQMSQGEPVEVSRFVDALSEGDADAATEILQGLIAKPAAAPQIDETAIVERVQQQFETRQAWADFVRENPSFADRTDEQGNPAEPTQERQYGDFLFATKYGPLVEQGQLSYREALNRTAADVTQVFTRPDGKQVVRPQAEARRQGLDHIPTATGRAQLPPDGSKVKSPAEIIADMRRARGLA